VPHVCSVSADVCNHTNTTLKANKLWHPAGVVLVQNCANTMLNVGYTNTTVSVAGPSLQPEASFVDVNA
jgi:hypothetical protein